MANELRAYRSGDPFQVAQDQMYRLFQALNQSDGQRRGERGSNIVPPAEAVEEDSAYRLILEIPGVDPKDVDVSVIGSTLTIKADRRQQDQEQGEQQQGGQQGQQGEQRRARHYLFSELQRGTLRREFGLPEDADRQRISAEFRNGLLALTIPKSQEAHQRRKIEVQSQ